MLITLNSELREYQITNVTLFFCRAYEGLPPPAFAKVSDYGGPTNDYLKYGTGFVPSDPWDISRLIEIGTKPSASRFHPNPDGGEGTPYFYASTVCGPARVSVESGNYVALANAFHLAEVRNIKRDALLNGMVADLRLQVVDYSYPGVASGKAVRLTEIILRHPNNILEKARA